MEANGYMWDYHPNKKLTGSFNDIVYKTDKEAYSACAGNRLVLLFTTNPSSTSHPPITTSTGSTDCKGVTQHADNKYRLNTDIMPRSAKGKNAYIQGSKLFKLLNMLSYL